MYVMTIDQRDSRAREDAVPELLALLDQVETVRDFERTIGDEVQGVLAAPEHVVLAVRLLAAASGWHIGVGIGAVETPLPESTAAGRGEAFYAAREAVEAAKTAPANLVVSAPGSPAGGRDSQLAQSALRLLVWTIEGVREQSRRYVDYRLEHPQATQKDIAADFDVSQQAVSRVLSTGIVEIIDGACALSAHHLGQADGEADKAGAPANDAEAPTDKAGDHVV